MTDYWNDPPEIPEPPECPNDKYYESGNKSGFCPGSGEYLYNTKSGMLFSCDTCGYQWEIVFPVDPEPEPELTQTELDELEAIEVEARANQLCPHGKIGSCDACDHLSDLAYDADREPRYFGR